MFVWSVQPHHHKGEVFVWHLDDNSSQVALSEIFQLIKGDDISTLRYCVMH